MNGPAKLIIVGLMAWHQHVSANPADMADVFVQVCTDGKAEFSQETIKPIEWNALPSSIRDFRPYLKSVRAYKIVKPKSGFLIVGKGNSSDATLENPVCALATKHIYFEDLSAKLYNRGKSPFKWTLKNPESSHNKSGFTANGFTISYNKLRDKLFYIEFVNDLSLREKPLNENDGQNDF
jgi:hypothetical protein